MQHSIEYVNRIKKQTLDIILFSLGKVIDFDEFSKFYILLVFNIKTLRYKIKPSISFSSNFVLTI